MKKLLLLITLLLTTACSTSGGPAGPLVNVEDARARWAMQGMQSYRFDLERMCFCVPEAREPVTVEVRNGVVIGVTSRNSGAAMLPSDILSWPTVDQLFDMIDEAEQNGEEVLVEYDALGYPAVIEIGSMAADAGTRFLIGNMISLE